MPMSVLGDVHRGIGGVADGDAADSTSSLTHLP